MVDYWNYLQLSSYSIPTEKRFRADEYKIAIWTIFSNYVAGQNYDNAILSEEEKKRKISYNSRENVRCARIT